MTRALAHCRWCGTDLSAPSSDPAGRGRPPTFCCDDHRRLYRKTFDTVDYSGPVGFEVACDCHGIDTAEIPGPVRAPGAYADAYAAVCTAMYGHPVDVDVYPVDRAGGMAAGTLAGWYSRQVAG